MSNHSFTPTDYVIEKREELYKGIFCLARYHVRHRLFNGHWSESFSRELLERKSAVGVLPYDPILDQVVLIEQFRPGPLFHQAYPWVIEIAAGVFDEDETAEEVAIRETEEEAGCKILDLELICDYFVSPGGSNEHIQLFCARIDASQAGGVFGLDIENEDIRAFVMPRTEALAKLERGEIKSSPALIGLLWLQVNHARLRELWR